mmetsp:Transcript_21506/g.57837  ORF Transcript_21506/g.57837 Transcript_21506/m.57837 type:complete len:214 (-) Transcript_21506:15-656(-)
MSFCCCIIAFWTLSSLRPLSREILSMLSQSFWRSLRSSSARVCRAHRRRRRSAGKQPSLTASASSACRSRWTICRICWISLWQLTACCWRNCSSSVRSPARLASFSIASSVSVSAMRSVCSCSRAHMRALVACGVSPSFSACASTSWRAINSSASIFSRASAFSASPRAARAARFSSFDSFDSFDSSLALVALAFFGSGASAGGLSSRGPCAA